MVTRRKSGSTSTSRDASRRTRSAAPGARNQRRARAGESDAVSNGESAGFSNSRRAQRAARGSAGSAPAASDDAGKARRLSSRMGGLNFNKAHSPRSTALRIVIAVACLAVVAAVVFGVSMFALTSSINGKMILADSDVSSALTAATSGEASYTVVAADLDEQGQAGSQEGSDAIALVRVDESSGTVTVVPLPANLQVGLSDGKYHPLSDAMSWGDAELIEAIETFADVSVSHYVKADAEGIKQLVDSLGGVETYVTEEVDDPTAGDVYIASGTQTVSGDGALTLLRATNYAGGVESQMANQQAFLTAVSQRLLEQGGFDFLRLLDKVSGTFATDVDALGAMSMVDALRSAGSLTVYSAQVPGYESTTDGTTLYVASTSSWGSVMDLVDAGSDPAEAIATEEVTLVDPGSFTLSVRNGGGISGAAAQATETLTGLGYDVVETGNTDTSVYTETLVIYTDSAYESAADTVVSSLGFGRTVAASEGYYTFDSDVLLILGTDWKPTT